VPVVVAVDVGSTSARAVSLKHEAFPDTTFAHVEDMLGLVRNTLKGALWMTGGASQPI
jgi:hypothetical protein